MSDKFSKLEAGTEIDVQTFVMPKLDAEAPDTFRTPTLGADRALPKSKRVAVPPPSGDDQKGRRFYVDPILRDLLSADDETETKIERAIEERLGVLRSEAEKEGRDAGYDEGYERGKAEAKANFEEAAKERLDRFDAFIDSLESMKIEIFQANERFLIELIFRIAGNVLNREISWDTEYIGRLVRDIVENVGVKEQLKLIVHASQVESLYALLPELEKKHAGLKNVTIETSSRIGETDVVVETDWNRIDATLESQMATLHEALITSLEESQAKEVAETETPKGLLDDDSGDKESA